MVTILSPTLYFSYSQFMVYDASVKFPGCAWTSAHSAQGFARRDSNVNFSTLLEFGEANVRTFDGPFDSLTRYERVIAVPFHVSSGDVIVEGPEEQVPERRISLPGGEYRLVAAQCVIGDEEEAIDLFFEKLTIAASQSSIIVADRALAPPAPLLETADVAGGD